MAVAAVTDVLDGHLARRQARKAGDAQAEPGGGTGAWLDPICDKLFVAAVLAAIIVRRHPPPLLIGLILTRELVQVPMGVAYRFIPTLHSWLRYDFRASVLGKAATVAQFLAIAALILDHPVIEIFALHRVRAGDCGAGRLHAAGDPDRQEPAGAGRSRFEAGAEAVECTCMRRFVRRDCRLSRAGPLALAGALAVAGCAPAIAQGPPAPSAAATATADTGMRVEKVREELQLAPWDLAFSAVRGTGVVTETVTARNLTDDPVTVRALPVLGDEGGAVSAAQPAQAAGDRAAPGPAVRRGDLRAGGRRRAGGAPRAAAVSDRTDAGRRPGHRSVGAGDAGPRRRARAVAGRRGGSAGLRGRRARRGVRSDAPGWSPRRRPRRDRGRRGRSATR